MPIIVLFPTENIFFIYRLLLIDQVHIIWGSFFNLLKKMHCSIGMWQNTKEQLKKPYQIPLEKC